MSPVRFLLDRCLQKQPDVYDKEQQPSPIEFDRNQLRLLIWAKPCIDSDLSLSCREGCYLSQDKANSRNE